MNLTPTSPTTMIVIAALALLAGCSGSPEAETTPAAGTIVEYEVFGMDCPGCHGGLEKLARDIEGVGFAKASWVDKTLTLGIADGVRISDEEVHTAIERANFTAGERLK